MYRFISLCAVCFITMIAPSRAQPIDAAGAKQLKTVIEAFLDQQKSTFTNTYYATLEAQGDVSVEPAGSYYAATLPFLKIVYPSGERLDVGMISINATPGDADGRWKMAIALPTPMTFYDDDGADTVNVAFGGQRAAGIWDESMKTFVKYDALYSDIAITARTDDESVAIKIPQTIARYDFTEGNNNKLSGNGYVSVNNMTVGADAQNQGKLNELRIDFETKNFDIAAFQKNNARIQALTNGLTTQGADTKAIEQEMMTAILNTYRTFGDKLGVQYTLKGLSVNVTDKKTDTPRQFALKDATVGFDAGGFDANKAFFGFDIGFHGMDFNDPNVPSDIVPSDFNIDIAFKDLPFDELVDMGQNAAKSMRNNPESKGMVGLSLMMRLPALLSQAGSQAELLNTYIGNDDYRFAINGDIQANIQAVTGMVADLNATFRGLDTLLDRLAYYEQSGEGKAQYGDIIKQLQTLQAIGDKSGGGDTYMYKFNLEPSGAMTLNGKPAQSVLGGR